MLLYSYNERESAYAAVFASLLVFVMIAMLGISFLNAGPIIVGTELNTNGLVEYLCLGRGCEDLYAMDW